MYTSLCKTPWVTNACLKEFAMDLKEVCKTTVKKIDWVILKTKKKIEKEKNIRQIGAEIFANEFW